MNHWSWMVGGSLALGSAGCLGGAPAPPVTPAGWLEAARASASAKSWAEARTAAIQYWVSQCKPEPRDLEACSEAQLLRAEAEMELGTPEAAVVAFRWLKNLGATSRREAAIRGGEQAKSGVERLLQQHAGKAWLVVEQDFEENHKFGPERAIWMLDGQKIASVFGRAQFDERHHRALAVEIAPGPHRLTVEIHWKGEGTFDSYTWSSFLPIELEASEGKAHFISFDVTYKPGGPSNDSVEQDVTPRTLP
jgi:hypothetical protein